MSNIKTKLRFAQLRHPGFADAALTSLRANSEVAPTLLQLAPDAILRSGTNQKYGDIAIEFPGAEVYNKFKSKKGKKKGQTTGGLGFSLA